MSKTYGNLPARSFDTGDFFTSTFETEDLEAIVRDGSLPSEEWAVKNISKRYRFDEFCVETISNRNSFNHPFLTGYVCFFVPALVVRFITRRFIGEYDPNLEKVYNFHTLMDNEMVFFEILDTAAQPHVS